MLAQLVELARYRELIVNLTVRELKARYKGSVLGFVWSLLSPLGMMLVFTFVFTVMMPSNQIRNFPVFVLCGLLPWQFFNGSILSGTSCIVVNGDLIKKVYFPLAVLPVASVLANLVNFLLALVVLFIALLISRVHLSPYALLLPIVILIQACFITGMVLTLSTLHVFYRDTLMVLEVVLLAWFFLTPVFYPIDVLPQSAMILGWSVDLRRWMYILNPVASLISTYRDLLYWGYRTNLDFFLRTAVTSLAVLGFGLWFFSRYSHRFSEEI